jgi:hypothetical protein
MDTADLAEPAKAKERLGWQRCRHRSKKRFDDFSPLPVAFWFVQFGALSVKEVVDRVMQSSRTTSMSNLAQTELRNKVGRYVELLSSAGDRDLDELTHLGVAYLHHIIDGPDPRYTGC